MKEKRISALKAIRLKCLDCSCGSAHEVKLCPCTKCPLYPFREGHNPFTTKREWTEEQREAQRARFAQNVRTAIQEKNQNASSEGTYIPQVKNDDAPIKAGGIADG